MSQSSTSSTSTLPDVGKCNISDEDSITITGKFENFEEFEKKISAIGSPTGIKLFECSINTAVTKSLSTIPTLESISFDKYDENIFMAFKKQNSLTKIEISNEDWTWNGFPHDVFNNICKNCKKLDHLVLKGAGTGSYFDCDDFPYKVTKLETTMITFNWYKGMNNERVSFLKSQKGYLKDLTIDKLPYDFDGGKVLKYIIDEMNLETFYYGKIPLILDGKKQKVKEFTASELQITSAIEMIKQFPSIKKFTLKLYNTDISCDDIEQIIYPQSDLFKNIKELEFIDKSNGHLEVYLGLFRNLKNVQKIIFKTKDKNLYKIINLLPQMPSLKEILFVTTAPISSKIDASKFAPNVKFTKVMDNNAEEVQGNVGNAYGGAAQDDTNAPGGSNTHRRMEGSDLHGNRRGGDGGDDDENWESVFKGCKLIYLF